MLAALALAGLLAPWAHGDRLWSPDYVRDADLWTDRMNDARVTAGPGGLRVEVAPGRQWAIAAVPKVSFPEGFGGVRVRVGALGGGGKWLVRLYGDLRATGTPLDVGPFQGATATGESVVMLDPRALDLSHHPLVQVQLGLEGPPGAFALFESLEFVPKPAMTAVPVIAGQRNIPCVDMMPNLPRPFRMRDWRAVARGLDRLAFDFSARGQYLPLIWLDNSHLNSDAPAFGLPSYVGSKQTGADHESITTMGAVLGATLVGIDKSRQDHDYVAMCEAYFNRRNGQRLVLNRLETTTGGSFWYEIFPHIVFYALADLYPSHARLGEIVESTADRWADACFAMRGPDGTPDFDHTAFDFAAMRPADNGRWREPDAAAGIAWLEYAAWRRDHNPRHLQAADLCMEFLQRRRSNPYYENLLPWGTLTAARMKAELGRDLDVDKLLKWCFGISDCRGGWGVTVGNWGGYDCSGLLGSVDNQGGYAFAMNTFVQAGALTPLVRYDPSYARAIGKWILNLANSARLFYPSELPADHQSSAFWKGDPESVIAYEGLRHQWNDRQPFATGDAVVMKWGPETDLGMYGSVYVGMLGALVHRTSDERILALDCLATDFYRDRAWPTYLIFNPYAEARRVRFGVGAAPVDLYDAATGSFLARGVHGEARFALPGDRAAVVVLAPAGGKLVTEPHRTLIDGVVVDYVGAARRP